MHGKALRKLPRHSVVLDCVCVLSVIYNGHAVRLAVSFNAKIQKVGKNSPTVLSRLWAKVHEIWGHVLDSM